MTTAVKLQAVVAGKKVPADRAEVLPILVSYQTAKRAEKAGKDAAEEARGALIGLVGDGDMLVDDRTGLDLCGLPVRSRPGLPPVATLLAEFADLPDVQRRIEALVKATLYRVVVAR